MFKLMDRQSLIEGLHPKGDSPPTLDAGTIEFEDVKFFYPFRPEIQVADVLRPGTFKKKKTIEKQHPYEYTRKHLKLRNNLPLKLFFMLGRRSDFLFFGGPLLAYFQDGNCWFTGGLVSTEVLGFQNVLSGALFRDMVWWHKLSTQHLYIEHKNIYIYVFYQLGNQLAYPSCSIYGIFTYI